MARGRLPRAVGATLAAAAMVCGSLIGSGAASQAATPAQACTGTVCDDFETQTGTQPSGLWQVSYQDCQGTGTATIDTSVAHSGTRSVRINGGGNYCNHVFVGTPTTGLGAQIFARFWVRHSTAQPQNHTTFVAMHDAADNNRNIRIGGQNGALQWNRESDDATLPAQSPVGVSLSTPLPVNQWTCLEFRLDTSAGHIDTWVNGAAIEGLTVDGVPTQDVDSQWLNRTWRPQPTDFRFGWESYGNDSDTLWFDDVALGGSRIGC